MSTVMTSNNAYDSILLVDENDHVVSAWAADRDTVRNFLKDGGRPDEWQIGEFYNFPRPDEIEEEPRRIADYGSEVGRNGVIANEERREFWGL